VHAIWKGNKNKGRETTHRFGLRTRRSLCANPDVLDRVIVLPFSLSDRPQVIHHLVAGGKGREESRGELGGPVVIQTEKVDGGDPGHAAAGQQVARIDGRGLDLHEIFYRDKHRPFVAGLAAEDLENGRFELVHAVVWHALFSYRA
jgi:hypothetical protein